MHQSVSSNQAPAPPLPQLANPAAQVGNAPGSGFYLQVTKDAQQGTQGEGDATATPERAHLPSVPTGVAQPSAAASAQQPLPRTSSATAMPSAVPAVVPVAVPTPLPEPYPVMPPPAMPPPSMLPPSMYPPPAVAAPPGGPLPLPHPQPQPSPHGDPARPPSVAGGVPPYGAPLPPPGPGPAGYYGAGYPEYYDGRAPYMPTYPVQDPRAQPYQQDDPYRRADPRYNRYEAERQPERPSSRSSQYSERSHSSRQGYEDYQPPARTAQDDYYADYYKKQYDYGAQAAAAAAAASAAADRSRWYDPNAAGYDPRYRAYYDQASYNWYNYNPEAYRRGEAPNYSYPYGQQYVNRREGYDDPYRYYPGYDMSFEEDYRRQRDPYADEFDRRSVGSERSSHSVHSHSEHTHSRRNSFSSHSQQSQVYRSQPDLVAAAYDPTASGLPLDYSSYSQYPTQQEYTDTNSWPAVEQPPPRPLTPEKFCVPHRCARFGAAGQLIIVQPNMPSAGQPALIEVHNMEVNMTSDPLHPLLSS
ncbi:protein transport protein Sec16A-like isoform X2 [Clupea harengus]|uniref:Protein transport protein Sec16A-like isoform X2 n=1 Tax=Clupea harengus TaxID=7950 RepID=A0A8M1KUL2_CLUHA|nr:protein transport protein Sec16A-like isoform X2 [Clupea harengus]